MNNQIHKVENNPLVSIVIGNYNYDKFLGQAIDSALNQTYPNIEVIVVDDGSQDKSREIIASYGNRIIPILKKNGGQPSCYNEGFLASRGTIICFLDSDDIFLVRKVAEVVKVFESFAEVAWCFHSIQLISEKGKLLDIVVTPNYISRQCDFRGRIRIGKIPPALPPSSGLSFRKSLLEKILPMPTTRQVSASDYYIKFLAVALGKGFTLSENLAHQRIHDNNAATLRKDRQHIKAREYLLTGKWIKQEFPQFKKFANKLFAVGIFFNKNAKTNDYENNEIIQNYLKNTSIYEKINISTIIHYFSIRGGIELMLKKAKKLLN
ncbi:glycosyltransferase family 2 protein [Dendronalium sp. ChiSLP03b]|uniref:glycosyltransferase family 2 protein n=1 Tax=Dendronalium sp. ChiSLP03b TaxID=3075381 RepID=UPI002AD52E39|nr:glycosyltransferase [Dendronalium sp. ChiSLP03b]MDZ8202851.1 glycosyltransferase [Dendronalium sp. ChiSLP03b]